MREAKSSDWQRKPKVITQEQNTGLEAGGGGGGYAVQKQPRSEGAVMVV